ncbi:hypothetical protein ACFV4G_39705 [Kitasatospora sp. NPDC059747]|uniref:hypothetical protein n=1 Tax=Kitasatospora sp. NPDC059747 TaxID=3346930 RepID=UPI003664E3B3
MNEEHQQQHTAESVGVHITTKGPIKTKPQRRRLGPFTVGQVPIVAGAAPVRILGANPQRTRLCLRTSTSPGSVWVGPQPEMATPTSGFCVPNFAGEELVMFTEREIWASSNVNGAFISFLAEHCDD